MIFGRIIIKRDYFLLDTHALLFWNTRTAVSRQFVAFLDKQEQGGTLYVSSISFWEIALLVKKDRVELKDVHSWKNELLNQTNIGVIEPSATEMIESTLLPDFHKDPFDRLLVTQTNQNGFILVTRDANITQYEVNTFWM